MKTSELLAALEEVASTASYDTTTIERLALFAAGDALIRRLRERVTMALQVDSTRHYLAKASSELESALLRLTLTAMSSFSRSKDYQAAHNALRTLALNAHMLEPTA